MFRGFNEVKAIDGLDRIFGSDPKTRCNVIVTGNTGAMKSTFSYQLVARYLDIVGETGLYITLEQPKDSFIAQLDSLGIPRSDRLLFSDLADFRSHTDYSPNVNIVDMVYRVIGDFCTKNENATCLVFDSLNAFLALGGHANRMTERNLLFEFFDTLGRSGMSSFIISERTDSLENAEAYYLADGLLEMGTTKAPGMLTRYLQVKKLRGAKHSMEMFGLDVEEGVGIKVVDIIP